MTDTDRAQRIVDGSAMLRRSPVTRGNQIKAIAAALATVRAEERAAAVSWVRLNARIPNPLKDYGDVLRWAADTIERGDHLKP